MIFMIKGYHLQILVQRFIITIINLFRSIKVKFLISVEINLFYFKRNKDTLVISRKKNTSYIVKNFQNNKENAIKIRLLFLGKKTRYIV